MPLPPSISEPSTRGTRYDRGGSVDDQVYGFLSGRLSKAISEETKAFTEGFTAEEWRQLYEVEGCPLYLEHRHNRQIGELIDHWVDEDDWLCVSAIIYKNQPDVERVYRDIVEGRLHSLSIGFWSDDSNRGPVRFKKFVEASVTSNPVEKGARIFVARSEDAASEAGGSGSPTHMATMSLGIVLSEVVPAVAAALDARSGVFDDDVAAGNAAAPAAADDDDDDDDGSDRSTTARACGETRAPSTPLSDGQAVQARTVLPITSETAAATQQRAPATSAAARPSPASGQQTRQRVAPSSSASSAVCYTNQRPPSAPVRTSRPLSPPCSVTATTGTTTSMADATQNGAPAGQQQQQQPPQQQQQNPSGSLGGQPPASHDDGNEGTRAQQQQQGTGQASKRVDSMEALRQRMRRATAAATPAASRQTAKTTEEPAATSAPAPSPPAASGGSSAPRRPAVRQQQQQQHQQAPDVASDMDVDQDESREGDVEADESDEALGDIPLDALDPKVAKYVQAIAKKNAELEKAVGGLLEKERRVQEEQRRQFEMQCEEDYSLVEQADKDLAFLDADAPDEARNQLRAVFFDPEFAPLKRTIANLLTKTFDQGGGSSAGAAEPSAGPSSSSGARKRAAQPAPPAETAPAKRGRSGPGAAAAPARSQHYSNILEEEMPEEAYPSALRGKPRTGVSKAELGNALGRRPLAGMLDGAESLARQGGRPILVQHSESAASKRSSSSLVQDQFALGRFGANEAAKRCFLELTKKTANFDRDRFRELQKKVEGERAGRSQPGKRSSSSSDK